MNHLVIIMIIQLITYFKDTQTDTETHREGLSKLLFLEVTLSDNKED